MSNLKQAGLRNVPDQDFPPAAGTDAGAEPGRRPPAGLGDAALFDEEDCSCYESAREMMRNLGQTAPELAFYQEDPLQMPGGSIGKTGYLRLEFEPEKALSGQEEGGRPLRTILRHMDRRVPLMAQKALYYDETLPEMACLPIITTTGCVIQGDRYALSVDLKKGSLVHLTTQCATKVHMMDSNYALQVQHFTLAENSYCEYVPDPLILHRDTRYLLETKIRIDPTATFLYGETVIPGRKYHHEKELFGFRLFSSRLSAEHGRGRPVFTERFIMEPHARDLGVNGVMNHYEVFANILLLTPEKHAQAIFAAAGAGVDRDVAFGALRLPHEAGLLFKVLGMRSEDVRDCVRRFHSLVRRELFGVGLPAPYLWK